MWTFVNRLSIVTNQIIIWNWSTGFFPVGLSIISQMILRVRYKLNPSEQCRNKSTFTNNYSNKHKTLPPPRKCQTSNAQIQTWHSILIFFCFSFLLSDLFVKSDFFSVKQTHHNLCVLLFSCISKCLVIANLLHLIVIVLFHKPKYCLIICLEWNFGYYFDHILSSSLCFQ